MALEVNVMTTEWVAISLWNKRREIGQRVGIDLPSWDQELEGLREDVRSEARRAIETMIELSTQ